MLSFTLRRGRSGRRAVLSFTVDEVGVAADLAKLEEGVENGDLGLRDSTFGDGVAHSFVHGDADGFVEVFLCGGESDGVDEDGFGWEVFGNFVFGAT